MNNQQTSSKTDSKKRWRRELPAFLDAASSVSATAYGARRLPELKALYRTVHSENISNKDFIDEGLVSGGHKTATRHLRRRTTSYKSRKRHRYPTGPTDGNEPTKVSTSRKARRKPALLRYEHSAWQRQHNDDDDDDQGMEEETATDGDNATNSNSPTTPVVHWLPTHLWHTKRFHMHDMFGWKVPLYHTARGVRALERLLPVEGRTSVQDVSWRMQPIILKSSLIDSLAAILTKLCPSFVTRQGFWGEGVLHEPGAFPSKAIGPAKWSWVEEESSLYLFVHPSMRPRVLDILNQLKEDNTSMIPALDGGMACFQLRGRSSSATLMEALQIEKGSSFDGCTSHLSTLKVAIGIKTNDASVETARPFGLQKQEILLVRCNPTNDDVDDDEHTGWDLLCSVSDAHAIFLALVMHPTAISIGYMEECQLNLKASIDMFPMTYPDCEQGQQYWRASPDWNLLREAMQGSGGRIRNFGKPNNINTAARQDFCGQLELIASAHQEMADESPTATKDLTASNDGCKIVVVRGMFGQPFVDLLQQCARLPTEVGKEAVTKPPRRKRRAARTNPTTIRLACRISADEVKERIDRVTSLSNSLSLDALIKCHIQVRGKGTLRLGDSIYGCFTTANATTIATSAISIGMVTKGSFSGGSAQGCGFLGAARLLSLLESCSHPAMMNGYEGNELVVEIGRETDHGRVSCKGTLSLML